MNIQLYPEVGIANINQNDKIIIDTAGEMHGYDILIIATGSRPFIPREAQLHLPGRFTMRERTDADKLKTYLSNIELPNKEQHVAIVGGGLLGLELAAALKKININITIIQRAPRLMERQLDLLASKLLLQDVNERDIKVYFDNEVSTVFEGKEKNTLSVTLKTGRIFSCNAIVFAIGMIPNIELGKEAKLKTGRGLIVNEYLQTSNPSIFALGEIAEFNNALYGITSSAEQQADIAAKFILGDLGSIYSGSVLMNILKFENLDLCSIGMAEAPENDETFEHIVLIDESKRYYKKCIVKDDVLVGAILMGDKKEFAEFKRLIEDRIELSDKRDELLRGTGNSIEIKGELICSCSQIGSENIVEAIKNGCTDFSQLCTQTGAGMGCGSCKGEVKEILLQNTQETIEVYQE